MQKYINATGNSSAGEALSIIAVVLTVFVAAACRFAVADETPSPVSSTPPAAAAEKAPSSAAAEPV